MLTIKILAQVASIAGSSKPSLVKLPGRPMWRLNSSKSRA